MNDIVNNVTGIAMGVIGLALLAVTVTKARGTAQVINAGSSGFAQVLTAAMAGGASSYGSTY